MCRQHATVIGNIEIDIEKFHTLKMLEATFLKSGYIFIENIRFTISLLDEGLCTEYPDNNNAVVGTEKLVQLMSSIEKAIIGD